MEGERSEASRLRSPITCIRCVLIWASSLPKFDPDHEGGEARCVVPSHALFDVIGHAAILSSSMGATRRF